MAKNKQNDLEVYKSLVVTRGVITILFGIMALVWPGMTVVTLALLVTLWLLASGVINIIRSILDISKGGFGWLLTLAIAVLELAVGAYLVQRPAITIATMVLLLGIVLVVEGVVAVVHSFMDGDTSTGERMLALIYGALSVVAGVLIWRYPVSGTLAFVWILGLFAVFTGPLWIALGLNIERIKSA